MAMHWDDPDYVNGTHRHRNQTIWLEWLFIAALDIHGRVRKVMSMEASTTYTHCHTGLVEIRACNRHFTFPIQLTINHVLYPRRSAAADEERRQTATAV